MLGSSFTIFATSTLLLVFLEHILPNFTNHENPLKRKYFFEDLLFLALALVLGYYLTGYAIKLIFFIRNEYQLLVGFKFIREMSWGWQFLISIIIRDFMGYWMHRITHNKYLWKFHLVHHESDYLDAAMSFRVHPVNFLFNISRSPLLILMGFDFTVLPLQALLQNIHNIFVHTNVKLDFGPLNYIFISPYLHRIHHAAEAKYHHKNYGVYLSIWDQMFGTFINEKNLEFKLGVEGHTRQKFIPTLMNPFKPRTFP